MTSFMNVPKILIYFTQGECERNEECPADKACEEYHCINPCKPETCKKTDFCKVLQHIPTCGFNFMEVPQEVRKKQEKGSNGVSYPLDLVNSFINVNVNVF